MLTAEREAEMRAYVRNAVHEVIPPVAARDLLDEIDRLREERDAEFDRGMAAVREEVVCSVCGENHDADESAACEGCEAVFFHEYVDRLRAEVERLREKPNQPILNAARRLVLATDNAERNAALGDLHNALRQHGGFGRRGRGV